MDEERLNETARMQQEARKRRLKAALRANLQRRKERARDDSAPRQDEPDEATPALDAPES